MTDSWLDLNGTAARLQILGEGPDVMMIGAAVPLAWSQPSAESLARLGYRVLNFDYGPPADWQGEPVRRTSLEQVADVVALLEHEGIDSVAAIGLSRGAITAYGLAALHPEVSHLVLAFPVAGFEDTIGLEGDEPPEREDPMEALDAALDTAFSKSFLNEHRQRARDLFLSEPGTVVRVERDEEETVDGLPTITVPTLIVTGGQDRVVLPQHPERLRAAIPHTTTYDFPEASHGFIMEQPDAFAAVVDGFMTS